MDTSVLTPEIMKADNPGLTEFGSGNVLALTSQCLRCAKKPTACTICAEFCPVGALETKVEGRPRITSTCIKCAACVGICPLNALAASSKTLQSVIRLALQASLRINHLVLGCERTMGLLRLETRCDEPEAATEALRLIEEACASEHLQKVPCLGMLTKELWFALLNEIGVSKLEEVSVFLPPGQCAECPVNAKSNIEDLFSAAIESAERWAHRYVGVITCANELPQTRKANVRAYLASETQVDRRGAFTGFLQELKQTWSENAEVGNRAIEEVRLQRERKKTFERTRLSADIKKGRPGNKNPIEVPTRYILVEALGRNDIWASEVKVAVSATDDERCTLCGDCIEVCPVRARKFVEADSLDPTDSLDPLPPSDKEADASAESSASKAFRAVRVDALYCVACSACLQACPAGACLFTEVEGAAFLLDEDEMNKDEDGGTGETEGEGEDGAESGGTGGAKSESDR